MRGILYNSGMSRRPRVPIMMSDACLAVVRVLSINIGYICMFGHAQQNPASDSLFSSSVVAQSYFYIQINSALPQLTAYFYNFVDTVRFRDACCVLIAGIWKYRNVFH